MPDPHRSSRRLHRYLYGEKWPAGRKPRKRKWRERFSDLLDGLIDAIFD